MANQTTILHPDASGAYSIAADKRGDIQRIDISDVDLLITMKNGDHYLLPGGGIAAMGDHPPNIIFADGTVSSVDLLSEVGAALDLAVTTPMPASFKIAGADEGASGKEKQLAKLVQKLEQQNHQQQEKIHQQQQQIDQQKHSQTVCADDDKNHASHGKTPCTPHQDDNNQTNSQVAPLNTNTSTSLEQMVQSLENIETALHNKDYDYTPSNQYSAPPAPPAPPPGVPPPISLTPIITLFMGNVVGTTEVTEGTTEYFYGGGGAVGSDASADIGPRAALQWSAATITGDDSNDVIYAEGPLLGNTDPATSNSTYYAKEFILSVAGYFTTLNAVTIKGVPSGVSIEGATNEGGGVWSLPASYVLAQNPFTIVYDTANYSPTGNNTFTLEFDVSGTTTRGVTFQSTQTTEFQYMDVTNVNQITDPTLVYDAGGYTKEIYVLPTLDQPNIITAGDGDDIVYGSRSNDTITLGDGNDQVTDGDGDNAITLGNGTDTITSGDGNNTVTIGDGFDDVTLGNGTNSIATGGGGGVFNLGTSSGSGANTITVTSPSGSTNSYTINALGTGATIITGGDDDYAITTGTGVDTIALGAGNDTISTSGGGGSISTGSGNQTITLSTASGSKDKYSITTAGSGTTNITAGDDYYTIVIGSSGANTIAIGSGASTITATTGSGLDSIATGNGTMIIAAGSGAGDNISVGTDATVADTVALSLGDGAGDSITTDGSTSSSGSIAIGSGNNDTISADSGSYTITVGGSSGTTNTLSLTSGGGDIIGAGSGNNTLYIGSHASGTDTVTLGNGTNIVYVGTGTNSIAAGSGSNVLNFNDITSALTIAFGATGTSTATASGISDSFTGFGTIYGTNYGDTITLNTGSVTVYAGSGNDTITLGTGADIVYAGNGNNTIVGTGSTTSTGDYLYGGTGNNTFSDPDANTTYNGTNGAALTAVANNLAYSFTNTSGTNPFANAGTLPTDLSYNSSTGVVSLYLQTQINKIDYSASPSGALNINLAIGAGSGSGGVAAGSFYAFTPSAGYSTIDAVTGNSTGDTLTPSYDSTILIGEAGGNTFQDSSTLASQTVIMVGNDTGAGTAINNYFMGLAKEIIVANPNSDSDKVLYGSNSSLASASNSAGVVVNFDDVSHTFSNTLFSSTVTVAAYSGASWGSATPTTTGSGTYGLGVGTSSLSWSAGDYFVPVNGTSTDIDYIYGSNYYANLVYGGTNFVTFYAGGSGSHGNFFYAGSGGSQYQMNGGLGVADVLTTGGTNIFATHNDAYNNNAYNIYVILNEKLDTGSQAAKDAAVNLTFGGTTYTGFAYGWGDVTTPTSAMTYISGYEDIVGYTGNDYFVGDNNNDQFNAAGGNNTIILGDGANIVTAIEGNNTITSSSASGQTIGTNTLNFETANDSYSGVIASYGSGETNTSVEAFLNYSSTTQSTFFSSGGDTTAFFGSSSLASVYEARTGTSSYSYDSVQTGIISTINGSDYWGGVTNSLAAATASSSTVNSTFTFDNVYSGAKTIIGHAGNDIFIDNIGTAAETFNGSADKSNIYYITPTQIADVTITGGGTSVPDLLRIEGATSANLATLSTDASSYKGIDVLDLRSGTDTVNTSSSTITMGAGSTTNSNAYTLSSATIDSLVNNGNNSTLVLKLDSGDTFTATTGGGITATDSHNAGLYYSDIITYKSGSTTVATLDIHYGSG